ncbi:hypothetical protein [Paraburkholderia humisilvae]|nr:hypothetical protein [Paraburkholderia humisilvae]
MPKLIADIDSAAAFQSPESNLDMDLLCRLVRALALTVEKLDHLAHSLRSGAQAQRQHLVLVAFQVAECIEKISKDALDGAQMADQKRSWVAVIDVLRSIYARDVPTLRNGPGATPSDAELILMLAECVRDSAAAVTG